MTAREAWRARLAGMLVDLQPELGTVALDDETRLGDDLGLDSLAFEELFSRLVAALPPPVPTIAWFNALKGAEGRAGVLLDLILAHEAAHASPQA